MIKKRHIIIFLSVIFINMIMINNAKALINNVSPEDVKNYKWNNIKLPDITQTPNYDSDLVYNSVLSYDPIEGAFGFSFYNIRSSIERTPFFAPRSGCTTSDFPVTTSSSCQDWGRVWWNGGATGYSNMFYIYYIYYNPSTGLYDDFRLGYSGTGNNNYSVRKEATFIWVQNNTPLQSTNNNSYIYNPNYLVSTFESGFMVDVTSINPEFTIYYQGTQTENDLTYYRYVFHVNNYSSGYTYQYRLMNYEGTSYISNWENILFSDNNNNFVYDSYNNIRIELKITNNSDNSVVFNQMYVVSAFSDQEIIITDNGFTDSNILSKKININLTDYNTVDYYFKISLDNGTTWHTYYTNNNINTTITSNSYIIVQVYSLINNENLLINQASKDIIFIPNGYDGYKWDYTVYNTVDVSDNEPPAEVVTMSYRYLFLSNLPAQGYIIIQNKDYTAQMKYYDYDLKEEITDNLITGREYTYNDEQYYIYEYDITQYYNQNKNVGVMIDSNFKNLGIFFVPTNTYLSYVYYTGTNQNFNDIKYVDKFDNDEIKTIEDDNLFRGDINLTVKSFLDLIASPITFIKNVILYIYNSLNIYIKGLLLTLFIYCIVGAVIKVIRR